MEIAEIKERLREAAETDRRLPRVGPKAIKSNFPKPPPGHDDYDEKHEGKIKIQKKAATNQYIDRLLECCQWLSWLPEDMRMPIWKKAQGMSWKQIARENGRSDTTWRRYADKGLSYIQGRLVERSTVQRRNRMKKFTFNKHNT